MFKTLQNTWPKDSDLPDRAHRLQMLTRVLDGSLYDKLKYSFHQETSPAQEYVPLRDRRPSVRYRLCKLVVDDSISLLFSEGHFPDIETDDELTKESIQSLAKEMTLNEVMIDAATRGAVGSAAVLLQVFDSRPFISVLDTALLTPIWKPRAPDTLLRVEERYKVLGHDLKDAGYAIKESDLQADFWFARDWTESDEVWYLPLLVSEAKKNKTFKVDAQKSINHKLGFVPIVWIKNLPGGDAIDGSPTLPNDAIDTSIEIDYQLSQAGRGLKYSSDPTLLLKEPAVSEGNIVKGAGNAIVVGADGDGKMLEINGTAAQAVIEYVRLLRELAIESMHGNRANTEKQTSAPSGKALEMMNQSLIWLADKLRISYGEKGLIELLNMLVKAHHKVNFLLKNGEKLSPFAEKTVITLRWPSWYASTMQDMLDRAQTLVTLTTSGLMSRLTAIKVLSSEYDIEDVAAEKLMADAEMKEAALMNKPAVRTKQTIFKDSNQMMTGSEEETK